jgi:hypothetical protein
VAYLTVHTLEQNQWLDQVSNSRCKDELSKPEALSYMLIERSVDKSLNPRKNHALGFSLFEHVTSVSVLNT